MTGQENSGRPRAGRGGVTKKGKPRPGTGGYGKRKLEGKGPTPPAHMRPGHPAQRRAVAAAARPGSREGGPAAASRPRRTDGPEMVAGRNAVVEALQARVPGS